MTLLLELGFIPEADVSCNELAEDTASRPVT